MAYTKRTATHHAQQLEWVMERMSCLLEQARIIVRDARDSLSVDADSWLSQIEVTLNKDHTYLSGVPCTLQEIIDDLYGYEEEAEAA